MVRSEPWGTHSSPLWWHTKRAYAAKLFKKVQSWWVEQISEQRDTHHTTSRWHTKYTYRKQMQKTARMFKNCWVEQKSEQWGTHHVALCGAWCASVKQVQKITAIMFTDWWFQWLFEWDMHRTASMWHIKCTYRKQRHDIAAKLLLGWAGIWTVRHTSYAKCNSQGFRTCGRHRILKWKCILFERVPDLSTIGWAQRIEYYIEYYIESTGSAHLFRFFAHMYSSPSHAWKNPFRWKAKTTSPQLHGST